MAHMTATAAMIALRERESAARDAAFKQFLVASADAGKRNPDVPLIESVKSGRVYHCVGEHEGDVKVKECLMTFYGPVVLTEIVIPASRLNAMRAPSPEEWYAMRMDNVFKSEKVETIFGSKE